MTSTSLQLFIAAFLLLVITLIITSRLPKKFSRFVNILSLALIAVAVIGGVILF